MNVYTVLIRIIKQTVSRTVAANRNLTRYTEYLKIYRFSIKIPVHLDKSFEIEIYVLSHISFQNKLHCLYIE